LLETQKFGNVTDSQLKTFAARLSYLIQIGCKPYELVEYPMILLLNKSEIDQRVEKLHLACNVDSISIGLLRLATPTKLNSIVKADVVRYLLPLGGCVNKVDEIVQELGCSHTKMMEILTRNPRLVGNHYRKDIAEKVRCLVSLGARHDDIYRNTNVLNNKTLATIRSRAERLRDIGWLPLPMGLIGREDAGFEAVVGQQETQRSLIDRCHVAGVSDVIRLLPPMSANRIVTIRPRIEYLLSQGYAVSDIVSYPQILIMSLEKIRMAVDELKPYHLDCADLAMVRHYAQSRRILSSRRIHIRSVIAGAIGCSRSALPLLPTDSSIRAVKDIHRTAVVNTNYLRDKLGFTTEDLASVPLVVVHAPDVVRRHWNALDGTDDSQTEQSCGVSQQAKALFRRHADRRLRLSLLQYSIEKEANFVHACVSTWAEDSDDEDELPVTRSASASAVDDDSDVDGDDLTFHDDDDDDDDDEVVDRRIYAKLEVVDESDSNDDDVDPLVTGV